MIIYDVLKDFFFCAFMIIIITALHEYIREKKPQRNNFAI